MEGGPYRSRWIGQTRRGRSACTSSKSFGSFDSARKYRRFRVSEAARPILGRFGYAFRFFGHGRRCLNSRYRARGAGSRLSRWISRFRATLNALRHVSDPPILWIWASLPISHSLALFESVTSPPRRIDYVNREDLCVS